MNEKAIDNSADGCLILILPVALFDYFSLRNLASATGASSGDR